MKKKYKMIYGIKNYKCHQCKRWKPEKDINQKGFCYDCGLKRMISSWKDLQRKKGPYWEKWKVGMAEFLDRQPKKKK